MTISWLPFLLLSLSSVCADDDDDDDEIRHAAALVYVFFSCLATVIIRHVFQYLECNITYSVFTILMGVLWGVGALYCPWLALVLPACEVIIGRFQEVILPAIVFTTAFQLDPHAFGKTLSQLMIISFPVCLMCACIIGLMMRQVLDTSWTPLEGVLLGVIISSIYPADVLHYLKETSLDVKNVSTLLEGEIILSSVSAITIFKLVFYYEQGYIAHWYQIVAGLLRFLIGGVGLGSFLAFVSGSIMGLTLNDISSLMLFTLAACYLSYFIGEYLANSGIITLVMTAVALGHERPSLSKEVEQAVVDMWNVISFMFQGVFLMVTGTIIPVYVSKVAVILNEYFIILVTYLMVNIVRFVGFFVFSPLLSRLGYGISFQTMIVCVWGGLKSPLCINLLYMFVDVWGTSTKTQLFFLNIIGVYVMMMLINASFLPVLFRAIGLADIPGNKQVNMTNCLKYMYEARARFVAVLKMDRLLSDANWPLVMSSTALKHPYRKLIEIEKNEEEDEDEEEEQEDYLMEYGFTVCPDCQKSIPNEPTAKEMKEMIREAKLRALKHKKTSYSRQLENGMISKEGARILHQAVDTAMDSEELVVELDGLFDMFNKQSRFSKYMRNLFMGMLNTKTIDLKQPMKKYRKMCYFADRHPFFPVPIHAVVVNNMFVLTTKFRMTTAEFSFGLLAFQLFAVMVYYLELWVKINARSATTVLQGVRLYFASSMNRVDFIVLLLCNFYVIFYIVFKSISTEVIPLWTLDLSLTLFLALRLFRVLLYFKLGILFEKLIQALSRYWSVETDENKTFAYEIARTYINGEANLLKDLARLVDNVKIRDMVRTKTEADKVTVTRKLGLVQIESPFVTARVKTKMAIRTMLNNLRDDILELKIAGWVDDFEYTKLKACLAGSYRNSNSIKMVEPSLPKVIFREQLYMGGDEQLIDFLYANVCTRKFDPGNIVYHRGQPAEGISILISGLLKVSYDGSNSAFKRSKELGYWPVLEHLGGIVNVDKKEVEYIVPGNSLGELSTVSGRAYDGYLSAEKHSEVFLLKREVLKRAMEMDPDPVTGLECRIWKRIFFHKAVALLLNVPQYRSFTQIKCKYIIERSFVPDLSNYKVFVANEMMQDIILMQGLVLDCNTRDLYTAPCYIPRTVQKLALPPSGLINVSAKVVSKLVVVPAKDYDEYEIMLTEERNAELVDPNLCQLRSFIEDTVLKSSGIMAKKLKYKLLKAVTKNDEKRTISFRSGLSPKTVVKEGGDSPSGPGEQIR